MFLLPVSAMAHTAWSTTSASKKLVENLKSSIAKAYAGSGDPEVYDCPHIIDVLAQKYPDPSSAESGLGDLACPDPSAVSNMGPSRTDVCGSSRPFATASWPGLPDDLGIWLQGRYSSERQEQHGEYSGGGVQLS